MEQINATKRWYVVYTKPRNEKVVKERLSSKGFEIYCPLVTTVRQWSDRKKKVQLPMFPSYIFAHINEGEQALIRADQGVINFIYWLGKPAVVQDYEIEAIKKIDKEGSSIYVENKEIKPKQLVVIPNGPFKGLEGIVDNLDHNKVAVYIKQLGCLVHFKI
ncbi:MAG: UpxY family transcription antiterminator [Fulvivirga sp.]|uniref:transcription termination/antitermination protein NusG n=1 Tax=Fulvivirga sp. TaxID=1931237 RepID=UPI0032EFF695